MSYRGLLVPLWRRFLKRVLRGRPPTLPCLKTPPSPSRQTTALARFWISPARIWISSIGLMLEPWLGLRQAPIYVKTVTGFRLTPLASSQANQFEIGTFWKHNKNWYGRVVVT
jgi:hypothetical protein